MIFDKIQSDLKEALRKKEAVRAGVLRLLLSEIHNQQIALRPKLQGKELSEEEVIAVIRRQAKKHQESIEAFRQGKRDDLVKKEQQELDILRKYLPQEMSTKELEKIIQETIEQVGTSGPGDFGKVMGAVMGKVKGKVGGEKVAEVVKKMLG